MGNQKRKPAGDLIDNPFTLEEFDFHLLGAKSISKTIFLGLCEVDDAIKLLFEKRPERFKFFISQDRNCCFFSWGEMIYFYR